MKSAGRNDPCPCGSGRKTRQCCGAVDDAHLAPLVTPATRESAITKLLTFAFQPVFDSDHSVAEIVFWGNLPMETMTPDMHWLMESEDANIKYNTWFLFDWDVDGQGTVADLFLEDDSAKLTPVERHFLTRLADANLRLYEVEEVVRGTGVRLVDLWTGRRVDVTERTATDRIVTWDLLGARVAPDGFGGHVFEGGLYLYPAEAKDHILAHFRRLYRRHQRRFPRDDADAFFRKQGMIFHHLWLKLVAFPEPLQVLTSEGDPLLFCRAVFETDDVDGLRRLIAEQPDVRALQDGRYALQDAAGADTREVGRWIFENSRVAFETTSQGRAARGRAWLEALAGDLVRYRATALETLEETFNELRRPRPSIKRLDAPPPSDGSAVRELYDRHYRHWLDRPDAALGNRTPRAAAATKLWRARLIDRLKQIENAAERDALHGRPGYDFLWIWKELGLDRPSS